MTDDMRREAERRLNSRITDEEWSFAVEEGWVEDADLVGEDGLSELVDFLGRARRAFGHTASRRATESRQTVELPAPIAARARLRGRLLLARARSDPHLVDLRTRLLAGVPMSPREAVELVMSPAAAHLPGAVFRAVRIPIAAHRARLITESILPSGDVNLTFSLAADGTTRDVVHRLAWNDDYRDLEYDTSAGRRLVATAVKGSVLDELRATAEEMSRAYGWLPGGAAALLLEDREPDYWPISGSLTLSVGTHAPARTAVRLEVESWVDRAVVANAYSQKRGELYGRAGRPLSVRTVERATFAFDYLLARPSATWPAIQTAWNEAHPDTAVQSYRAFRQSCVRVWSAVLRGPDRLPT